MNNIDNEREEIHDEEVLQLMFLGPAANTDDNEEDNWKCAIEGMEMMSSHFDREGALELLTLMLLIFACRQNPDDMPQYALPMIGGSWINFHGKEQRLGLRDINATKLKLVENGACSLLVHVLQRYLDDVEIQWLGWRVLRDISESSSHRLRNEPDSC